MSLVEVGGYAMDDVVSPDGKWRWDGRDWIANPGAEGKYSPGDSVNGHILGTDGHWHPRESGGEVRYDAQGGLFYGTLHELLRLGVIAIQRNGWTVTQANDSIGLLTFETSMSWGSWSGVTCTLSFQDVQDGWWQVTGSGKQNVRGAQLVAFDGGEAASKALKVIRTMQELAQPYHRDSL